MRAVVGAGAGRGAVREQAAHEGPVRVHEARSGAARGPAGTPQDRPALGSGHRLPSRGFTRSLANRHRRIKAGAIFFTLLKKEIAQFFSPETAPFDF